MRCNEVQEALMALARTNCSVAGGIPAVWTRVLSVLAARHQVPNAGRDLPRASGRIRRRDPGTGGSSIAIELDVTSGMTVARGS